ncbi:uncharacterized protein PGTG_03441 [Puccinia graminis f. sp. tritici CRL 75-36-700-3]|uniref:Uncharacterized protein n=2 Tax=Puccinia graminis f. sp. tritici TaxID=56615 RepID=E3JZL0_PUCGT|nr:uncharacterized protein PGTG_03441 [Puccinia graminis f. sp. tritici CRL 75-36-700-3]EFP77485.2 hypothetical protein PGTG_03441 [Puccinia graminis f. sp. tritici CRL 75-36-700-3]
MLIAFNVILAIVGLFHLIPSSSSVVLQRRMDRFGKAEGSAKSVTSAINKEQGRSGEAEMSEQVRNYEAGKQDAARSDQEEQQYKSNWSFLQATGYKPGSSGRGNK